jgi:hypothetical protein
MTFNRTLVGIALGALIGCGSSNDDNSQVNDSASTETVCALSDVPAGWVVINLEWTHECEGGSFNPSTYYIRKGEDGLRFCAFSRMPSGYLKISPHFSFGCQGGSFGHDDNAFVLKKI